MSENKEGKTITQPAIDQVVATLTPKIIEKLSGEFVSKADYDKAASDYESRLTAEKERSDRYERDLAEHKAAALLHSEYKDGKSGEPKIVVAKALFAQVYRRANGVWPQGRDDREARQYKAIQAWMPNAIKNALEVATDTAGGFAVPEEWEDGIVQTLKSESIVFAMGPRIRETRRDVLNIPAFNAKKSFQWLAENTGASEGTPTTRNVVLTPKKVIGLAGVSTEWLEDVDERSDADFRQELAGEFAEFLDLSLLESQSGGPTGLRNATVAAGNEITITGGTLNYDQMVDGKRQLKRGNVRPPYAWLQHPDATAIVEKLKDSNGDPLFKSRPDFAGDPRPLGYQTFESAQIATDEGVSSDETYMLLVKPSEVVIARRRGVTVAISEHAGFASDQIQLRITARFDIKLLHDEGLVKLLQITG